MKFHCAMLVVNDIQKSRRFYEEILGQKVILDFGENITFEGSFALQQKDLWLNFIHCSKHEVLQDSKNFELYFEEDDFDRFLHRLYKRPEITCLGEVKEYPWGQRVIRFYDPDYHIIEVGESMAVVVKRFLRQGLSVAETAARSQYPTEFVLACQRALQEEGKA